MNTKDINRHRRQNIKSGGGYFSDKNIKRGINHTIKAVKNTRQRIGKYINRKFDKAIDKAVKKWG